MSAPIAKQVPHVHHRPTGDVVDPWAWLRDRDDPDTIAYLEAENEHTRAWFALHQDLVERTFEEIRSRVQETDISAPVPVDDWWYSSRTIEGQSYPLHCRGRSASRADEHVMLDENVEAANHEFFDLGAFEVSDDHRLLAWAADTRGDERSTVRIRDLTTMEDGEDRLEGCTAWAGLAWSADSEHLLYVIPDEQERPYRVMRHRLGTSQSDDVAVFSDDDERFYVGVGATRNRRRVVISSSSKLTSECWILDAADLTADPRLVRARQDDVEYHVDDWGDRLVVLTNESAVDFRVMSADVEQPARWTELVAHVPGRRITGIEPFADFLALHEWSDAQPRVRILDRDGSESVLHIDAQPHDVEFGPNEQWSTAVVRLTHQSLTTPRRVIDVEVGTGAVTVIKQTPTPNVDLANYVSSRHWAAAPDGTAVPYDIVHHVDTALDGTAPCCVYGYGSYEASMPPWFSVARLSLLDRGVVWALAHPRGGGELGRNWYLDGKLLAKRNTFTDTLAVCDSLAESGAVDGDRIAIRGGSAGGLLVGACVTMSPKRFASAVAEVPFVDVVTSMSDTTLPLTVTEWDEWGNPGDERFASYMLSYSPYDNTVADDYPALYVTAGLNDPRVSFHEPAKWVAKLRQLRTNDALLLLHTEMGAGHAGPSGRYDMWRDEARVLVFLLTTLASSPIVSAADDQG